ncbi:MAG: cysteine desulfurase [Bacteroidota bacterium]
MSFDPQNIRKDFPILNQTIYGKDLVYFDNAATTQKPNIVIQEISRYYSEYNSNIHRGVHHLSQLATQAYEDARKAVQKFIQASSENEIIFTRGTTEGINLIASTFSKKYLKKGDEVMISAMEHHSNIVPWQMACEEKEAKLIVVPINDTGEIELDILKSLITERTRIISIAHISNVLGTINPVKEIISIAHSHGIPVVIDGAQATAHELVNVQELDCDFYCFSAHKMYGPTGIGVLYGKEKWLEDLPPYQGGGDMIEKVTFEKTTYNKPPLKFEAGTQDIAGAIGLKAAIDYLNSISLKDAVAYENSLLNYANEKLTEESDIIFYGTAKHKAAVISFNIGSIHPYDAGTIIDKFGIAVRTGHHCAQPLMDTLKIPGTVRASFSFYNTFEEIDKLLEAIRKVKQMFA